MQLQRMEVEQGITSRWTSDSDSFQDMLSFKKAKDEEKILQQIAVCARERWFVLNLKSKFAGAYTIVNLRPYSV